MTNEFFVNVENKFQGICTRLNELHWSAPSISIHKLVDEFNDEFCEFNDNLMENCQALWGFIQPGDLKSESPKALDFEELLEDIRGILVSIKREMKDNMLATGIINLVDEFFSEVNKYVYLIKIAKQKRD